MIRAESCRHCGGELQQSFCDLGVSPLANSFLTEEDLGRPEPFYPLHAYVCGNCYLVQLGEFESPEAIFTDYLYFSSYSTSWVDHARTYAVEMLARFPLDASAQIIEIASNDGYLLQHFVAAGVQVVGIEPAANVAAAAVAKGIPTRVHFFSADTAHDLRMEGLAADLLIGNNVLAHVPDINDFVRGLQIVLKPRGIITMEFPHLLRLMEFNQFDTIYHEHFSYFSLLTVSRIFAAHGLRIFDVQEWPTHGGSLRIFATHEANQSLAPTSAVEALAARERASGLDDLAIYGRFAGRVAKTKRRLLSFLIDAKDRGRQVVGYGAPAKGNTLLNYCGVGTDFLDYTVDKSPHKQGRFLPGTRVPVLDPRRVRETRPDYLLLLPWNLQGEIVEQMSEIRRWGGQFVTPIPELTVIP